MTSTNPVTRLRGAGLRVSSQRGQVLTALDTLRHPDADAIAGLVRRIEPAGHSV
jgi:Fe2+ or Zn2+ uptake regulation protein